MLTIRESHLYSLFISDEDCGEYMSPPRLSIYEILIFPRISVATATSPFEIHVPPNDIFIRQHFIAKIYTGRIFQPKALEGLTLKISAWTADLSMSQFIIALETANDSSIAL